MKKIALLSFVALMSTTSLFGFDHLKSVKEFEESTKKGNYIVDFYASWCNPCKEMEQNLKKLSGEKKDIKIYKVNIEESVELVNTYGTPQVPALLYIKDGEILQGYVGLKQMEELKRDMKKYFQKTKS
ncbi:MAG: thioredoxin family protein [Epsilonproteobacteria bacterium]|nr:thioredoxin family protein [Campylobacterota bacterium]